MGDVAENGTSTAPVVGGIDQLRRFVALTEKKKAIDAELKDLKDQIGELEPDVLEYMQDNGIQSAKVDGYTVYLRRDIRASFRGTPEAFAAVEANGLQDALTTTINAQRAASIVREFLKNDDEAAPAWLGDAFGIVDQFRAGIRKA